MNERIRELAVQTIRGWSSFEDLGERIEKFAELIVRECINCCDENSQQYIMSHFGLKESDWS